MKSGQGAVVWISNSAILPDKFCETYTFADSHIMACFNQAIKRKYSVMVHYELKTFLLHLPPVFWAINKVINHNKQINL